MDVRTCPHCNYKYSVPEYRNQVLFKFRFLEWNCKNCNKKLTFNFKRRVMVALTFVGIYVIFLSLKNAIGMTPLKWAALLTIFIFGSFFISTFDTFKKAE
jgi:CXXC-20-CXXC protein